MRKDKLSQDLGFDTAPVQGFFRHETIFFWMGRAPAVIFWSAAYFKNAMIAYGENFEYFLNRFEAAVKLSAKKFIEPQVEKSLTTPRRKSMKESGFVEHGQVALYDFTAGSKDLAERMKKISPVFSYREPTSIKDLLEKIGVFRANVKKAYGPYSALRRKSILMFMILDEKTLAALKADAKVMRDFLDLYTNGHEQRVFPFVVVKDAASLSVDLVKASDFALFLGEENEELAEKFYSLPIYDKEYETKKIGLSWDTTRPKILRRFSGIVFERTEWQKNRKAAIENESIKWREYLEELDKIRA